VVVFLGLVVAAVAMVIGIDIAVENTAPATLTVFGRTVPQVTTQGQVLLFGVGVTLVLLAGLVIVYFAMVRALRRRRELRYLREEAEESINTLELQKRQLQRELAQARRDTGQAPVPGKTAGPQAKVVSSFFDPAR
jgi:uncharacterized protein HemX